MCAARMAASSPPSTPARARKRSPTSTARCGPRSLESQRRPRHLKRCIGSRWKYGRAEPSPPANPLGAFFVPSCAVLIRLPVTKTGRWPSRHDGARPGTIPAVEKESSTVTQGTVKWFNESKGFGFIAQDKGEDVFVHYSAIQGDGYRNLTDGDRVEFEVTQGPKGLSAAQVRKI